MPSRPQSRQFLGVAALGHLGADLVDAHAMIGICIGAILSLAIGGVQLRGQPGGFGAQRGIGGRGQADAQLEQEQLARRAGRQSQSVKLARFADQLGLPRDDPVVGLGLQSHRIVGDIGLLDPRGAVRVDTHRVQFLLRAGDKGQSLGDGGLASGCCLRRSGIYARKQGEYCQE